MFINFKLHLKQNIKMLKFVWDYRGNLKTETQRQYTTGFQFCNCSLNQSKLLIFIMHTNQFWVLGLKIVQNVIAGQQSLTADEMTPR